MAFRLLVRPSLREECWRLWLKLWASWFLLTLVFLCRVLQSSVVGASAFLIVMSFGDSIPFFHLGYVPLIPGSFLGSEICFV